MIFALLMSVILVLGDQLVKWWVVQNFALYSGMDLIKGIVNIFYIQNTGAAWGIFSGEMVFFFGITAVAVVAMLYLMYQERGKSKIAMAAYVLILAGAIGNFIDRFRLGYVVDMIRLEFIDFPIFNVADMYLTIGVAILFIYIIFVEGKKEKRGE